jgi:transposase-like protein
VRKHYTKAQRAELIDLVTSGQMTTGGAAAQLGVAESTAYYWLKRSRESLALAVRQTGSSRSVVKARPTFVRLIPAVEMCPPITLRAGGVAVEVRAGFDHALLREVVAALVGRTP